MILWLLILAAITLFFLGAISKRRRRGPDVRCPFVHKTPGQENLHYVSWCKRSAHHRGKHVSHRTEHFPDEPVVWFDWSKLPRHERYR